eukprot:UN1879
MILPSRQLLFPFPLCVPFRCFYSPNHVILSCTDLSPRSLVPYSRLVTFVVGFLLLRPLASALYSPSSFLTFVPASTIISFHVFLSSSRFPIDSLLFTSFSILPFSFSIF